MIGQSQCQAVLQKALSHAHVDQAEAYLTVQNLELTRFAGNIIHQNVSHTNAQLHIRAVVGRRQGRATTNDITGEGIQRAVDQAQENALLMPEDPHFNGLPSPGTPPKVHVYDEDTGACSPESRARVVAAACRQAEAQGLEASGFYRTGIQETAVLSTQGAQGYHAATFAGFLMTVMSDTSAGWSKGGSWRISDIDPQALAEEAMGKALNGRDPRTIEPGEYTVVLDPYAVDDMLGSLSLYGMGAQSVQEGRSWMNASMGRQAMSPLVSIWDDGAALDGWPVPFDAEGVPRQRTDIVKDGVVGSPVHNSYTAGKEGRESTGHQAGFTGGPMATNLFMRPGHSSMDEIIGSTLSGLYITRFHYTRLVHNRDCVMTGMTRDGTFMIEDGQLSYPVKNLRFTQSYVEAMAGVDAVGSQRKLVLNEGGFATMVPALRIQGFKFTGVTV